VDRLGEVAGNRELWALLHGRADDEVGRAAWADDELRWGLFGVPETRVEALGDVAGRTSSSSAAGRVPQRPG
jgi:hypothetical protein